MKLNENKERIPATFITTYISDAWDKIGYINADIDAIKKAYSDTKGVVDCLQGIVDAYLIAAGRLQTILDKKDYVDFEAAEQVKEELKEEPKDVKENLQEDFTEVANDELDKAEFLPKDPMQPETPIEPEIVKESVALEESLDPVQSAKAEPEQFGYFCDFDEPELTAEDRATAEAISRANS